MVTEANKIVSALRTWIMQKCCVVRNPCCVPSCRTERTLIFNNRSPLGCTCEFRNRRQHRLWRFFSSHIRLLVHPTSQGALVTPLSLTGTVLPKRACPRLQPPRLICATLQCAQGCPPRPHGLSSLLVPPDESSE